MTTARDLVDAIASGKSSTIQATFDQLMSEKIQTGIEAYRQAVIDNTFNPELVSESSDEDLSIEEESDSIDEQFYVYDHDGKTNKIKKQFATNAAATKHAEKLGGNHKVASREYWHDKLNPTRAKNESEELDELSGATLGSYAAKAHADIRKKRDHAKALDADPKVAADNAKRRELVLAKDYKKDGSSKHRATIDKLSNKIETQKKKIDPDYPKSVLTHTRYKGIEKATDRLKYGKKITEEFDLSEFTLEEIQQYMESEDFATLDELSKETLGDYVRKKTLHHLDTKFGSKGETAKDKAKPKGANSGISRAMKRLYSGNESEELQLEDYSLEEIQEFMESEDYLTLDELSKQTLSSYVKKASVANLAQKDKENAHSRKMMYHISQGDLKSAAAAGKTASNIGQGINKRVGGIIKAANKLAKD